MRQAERKIAKPKFKFVGRDRGRYIWRDQDGNQVCCGIRWYWNPNAAPTRMRLTALERTNALAAALWEVGYQTRSVMPIAVEMDAALERAGYTLIKRRKGQGVKEKCNGKKPKAYTRPQAKTEIGKSRKTLSDIGGCGTKSPAVAAGPAPSPRPRVIPLDRLRSTRRVARNGTTGT